jgi:hypothetical protein
MLALQIIALLLLLFGIAAVLKTVLWSSDPNQQELAAIILAHAVYEQHAPAGAAEKPRVVSFTQRRCSDGRPTRLFIKLRRP